MAEPVVAVFDTNILVMLGLSRTRAVSALWKAIAEKRVILTTSEAMLEEVGRVLRYNRLGRRYGFQDVLDSCELAVYGQW